MKKFVILIVIMSCFLTACKDETAKISNEIYSPILETVNKTENLATAEKIVVSEISNVAGEIGYPFFDYVFSEVGGNLTEINLTVNAFLNKGDVLVKISTTALEYDLNNSKMLYEAAYSNYLTTGSEKDRLNYLIAEAEYKKLQYELDSYTIRAPFDCVVLDKNQLQIGDNINIDDYICTIAKTNEVFIYTDKDSDLFKLGADVEISMGGEHYLGEVVSVAENDIYRKKSITIIDFKEGEFERLLTDIPNAVTAGWATIHVESSVINNYIAVPSGAVKSGSNNMFCHVIEEGSRAAIPVEIGNSASGYTAVYSGLSVGDVVSLS